jgi:prepilin-type N-terminal cleavage/methylation domain-containing protein
MRSLFRKMQKGEKGFTLVELLVVFTLLGVLAAIMIPSVSTFIGTGQTTAAATELSVIQTAMDCMIASENQSAVTQVAGDGLQTMNAFPDGTHPLYPKYLRFATSTGNYTCDTTGLVGQSATGY